MMLGAGDRRALAPARTGPCSSTFGSSTPTVPEPTERLAFMPCCAHTDVMSAAIASHGSCDGPGFGDWPICPAGCAQRTAGTRLPLLRTGSGSASSLDAHYLGGRAQLAEQAIAQLEAAAGVLQAKAKPLKPKALIAARYTKNINDFRGLMRTLTPAVVVRVHVPQLPFHVPQPL